MEVIVLSIVSIQQVPLLYKAKQEKKRMNLLRFSTLYWKTDHNQQRLETDITHISASCLYQFSLEPSEPMDRFPVLILILSPQN